MAAYRVKESRASQVAALGERDPLFGPVPDDDVIVEPEIEQPSAVGKLAGQPKILTGRGRISRRMIV